MRRRVILCFLLFLAAALLGGCQRKRIAQDVLIESFLYKTIGTAMGSETSLSIAREDEGYVFTESLGGRKGICTVHVGRENAAQVTDILRAHNALSWDGFSGSDPNIADGESFTLRIAFDDGSSVAARGTNSYPKGMTAAVRKIQNLFDWFLSEPEQ